MPKPRIKLPRVDPSQETSVQGWYIPHWPINAKDFMQLAKKHYQDAVLYKEWMRVDEDQQTILALQMEIKEFKASSKFKKKVDYRDKDGTTRSGRDEWRWKRVQPGDAEAKTKKFKGKTYHWCPNHNIWCLHKASECKLKQKETGEMKKKTEKFNKQQLRMQAFQYLFESSIDEEAEQEESSHSGDETEGSNTSEWLLGPRFMLCRPLFLLLYKISIHLIFAVLFNHEGLAYLSFSMISLVILLITVYAPK